MTDKLELPMLGSVSFPAFKTRLRSYLVIKGLSTALEPSSTLDPDKLELAKAYLIMACPHHLAPSLEKLPTVSAIWKELHDIYEPSTKARILTLQNELKFAYIKNNESTSDFLLRVYQLFTELKEANPLAEESMEVMQQLTKLPPKCASIVEHFVNEEDKLTFTKVQARIRQHEQFNDLQASNQSAVPSVPAFAVTTSHLPGSGPGHVSGNSGGQTTRPAHIPPGCCWNCGIPGHHSRNCPNEPLLATAQTAASSRRPGEDAGNPIVTRQFWVCPEIARVAWGTGPGLS